MPRLAHVWSSDLGVVASLPQLRYFLGLGWDIDVVCPDGPRLGEVLEAGVGWYPWELSRTAIRPLDDARAARALLALCRRQRWDLVHTHNVKAGLIGRVVAGLAGVSAVVHTMHGMAWGDGTPAPARLAHAGLEWLACRFADRILVQSEEDRRTLRRHHIVSERRLVAIGNGVPLDRFDPARVDRTRVRRELGLCDEEILFVSAGRLVHSKGFVELCQGAGLARRRDARVRVAIAGPRDVDKADCLSDAEMAAGRAEGVEFLGERSDMPEVLAAADVVVLPSWHEGMPRVLMEGAALGKPLLASDVRGCREVAREPGGRLFAVKDANAIADALVAAAADVAWRAAAGAGNRARALAEFDLAAVNRRVAEVYRELVR